MGEGFKKYGLFFTFLILLFSNICIFYIDWQSSHQKFIFAMLDVGQGDALFIESPTGTKVLVDAGPPKKIIPALSKVLSPLSREIDAIIITNPDADHISGFLDILKNYKVDRVFEAGNLNDSKIFKNLQDEIKKQDIPEILAGRGMVFDLGWGAVINILFTDRDVSAWSTNDGSIVSRLSYGNDSILLTGDATIKTEQIILKENDPLLLKSTILKVGHHGSRTSTSDSLIKTISPIYAFISDGKDNKYGHPHRETLETLAKYGVKIMRTDLLGTIVFSCDRMDSCEIKK